MVFDLRPRLQEMMLLHDRFNNNNDMSLFSFFACQHYEEMLFINVFLASGENDDNEGTVQRISLIFCQNIRSKQLQRY